MQLDLQSIANRLESEVCPVHGEHPTATVESVDRIKLTACCDEFKETLTGIYKEQLTDQTRTGITDDINNMFKQFRKN